MKIYLCLFILFLPVTGFAGTGDAYEPEVLTATSDAPVMLFLKDIPVGFTAIKVNIIDQLEIKSVNKKEIKIVALYSINIIEAIDAEDKVLTYRLSEYELLKAGITKMNKLLDEGNIDFEELLDSIEGKHLSQKDSGSSVPPDPVKFKKLRRVNVYNLLVENSEGKQNNLQVYVENYTDASELK